MSILPDKSNGPTRQESLGVNFQEMPGSDGDVEEERFGSAHFYRPGGGVTPLKTNMSPENQWLEDVFPTKIVPYF